MNHHDGRTLSGDCMVQPPALSCREKLAARKFILPEIFELIQILVTPAQCGKDAHYRPRCPKRKCRLFPIGVCHRTAACQTTLSMKRSVVIPQKGRTPTLQNTS